ncbi:trypsin-3-like [Oppia nitens]|uniref:trypsin-3-like n=1 Tax=Oppia nitens TaxID=1686743 RepID=UPI0023DBBEAB|nr:trypsin-3-like [Oppia nitens]
MGRENSTKRPVNIIQEVMGGYDADREAHGWMAAIMDRPSHGPMPWCGGSLVSARYVLTAAHCFDQLSSSLDNITVQLGAHKFRTRLLDFNQQSGSSEHRVDSVIKHPAYDTDTKLNDIALVKLREPVAKLSDTVIAITIDDNSMGTYEGQSVRVLGWGLTQDPVYRSAKQSEILQELVIRVWNNTDCGREVQAFTDEIVIGDSMLCAGGDKQGGRDACQHDSGGPLIHMRGNLWPILIGIVTAGIGCGMPRMPGIYTRVGYYADWINQTMHQGDTGAHNNNNNNITVPITTGN